MKKLMKVFSCMMMVVIMTAMLITPALAADTTVTYVGGEKNFEFKLGSAAMTDSDLFDNFKGMWPGDSASQTVTFKNESDESHFIRLYLKAESHDESGNVPVVGVEDVALMNEFLAAVNIKVTNGSEVIYNGTGDMGKTMTNGVLLGKFHKGEGASLKVELNIPLDLDNKFAGILGEVDWVFTAEQDNYPPKTLTVNKVWRGSAGDFPSTITVLLLKDGKEFDRVELGYSNNWEYKWEDLYGGSEWTVQEIVPNGYINSIKSTTKGDDISVTITNTAALIQTGQLNWPVPVMMILGLALMIVGSKLMRKERA